MIFKKILSIVIFTSISSLLAGQGKSIPLTNLTFVDIGNVARRGVATVNPGEISAKATGADIWGKHDEFLFGYTKLKGDFDVVVQIAALSPAHKYTKAGLMARTNLSDSSQHVFFQLFPDNSPRNKNNGGCEFQYRVEKGADMKAIYPDINAAGNKFNVSYPDTWIRLRRKGDNFESYIGNDNVNWNLYSNFTLLMLRTLYVGLALTSHNSNQYTESLFRSFQLRR